MTASVLLALALWATSGPTLAKQPNPTPTPTPTPTKVSNPSQSNTALEIAGWKLFNDPTGELSVMLPAGVKAGKTNSDGDQYECDDGEVTYRVGLRKRSDLPEAEEIVLFCDTFAKKFVELMKSANYPVVMEAPIPAAGKNWSGRLYRYVNKLGSPGAILIAVESKHNLILHSMGDNDSSVKGRAFFTSLVVHGGK